MPSPIDADLSVHTLLKRMRNPESSRSLRSTRTRRFPRLRRGFLVVSPQPGEDREALLALLS